jgi:RimJ/RimL family protein N-acetyltransferase/GNAT superfamily N-acetyltransferase
LPDAFANVTTSFELQPVLRGQRLWLRPLREEDWDQLFAVASDRLIWEQHPVPNRYQEEVFRGFFREAMESGGAFVVLDAKDDRVIGSSRYLGYDSERSEIEIGFTFLAREFWGGVYNREMKDLMLRHAFRFVRHVVFLVGLENWRSQKAMEKIGGRRVGTRLNGRGTENVVFQIDAPGTVEFVIRCATVEDASVVARHRARMFRDMGEIPASMFDDFVAASRAWTERALTNGEYLGWFAIPKNQPDLIVAGAGVQLRQVPPHPCRPAKEGVFAKGRHAIVLNVFTEPEWRKRGVALLLMNGIVGWAREEKLDQLVLHASAHARSLYEKMRFTATNEMRFNDEL